MKRLLPILALALLAFCASRAEAQTTSTPCNPATPFNAVCIQWTAVATMADGSPATLTLNYRIEQQLGAGQWVTVATGITATRAYVANLSPGVYLFRVYANCGPCQESEASNTTGRTITAPPRPSAPVITIAVVISSDAPPTSVTVNGAEVYASVRP